MKIQTPTLDDELEYFKTELEKEIERYNMVIMNIFFLKKERTP